MRFCMYFEVRKEKLRLTFAIFHTLRVAVVRLVLPEILPFLLPHLVLTFKQREPQPGTREVAGPLSCVLFEYSTSTRSVTLLRATNKIPTPLSRTAKFTRARIKPCTALRAC